MPSLAVLAVAGTMTLGVGRPIQGDIPLASNWSPSPVAAAESARGFWDDVDPADSLYKAARAALNKNDYSRAVDLFRKIRKTYPKSQYTPDTYYWEAFSLYRRGGTDDLRAALAALNEQDRLFPNASTQGDSGSLATRIQGELAKRGDSKQAERVDSQAKAATTATGTCSDDEDDTRIAALNALLQMDADRAIPILKKVLARRDACSEVLRRKAVFLVSQKRTAETEGILLNAARTDPDEEVRQQSVFWLSQVGTETAVSALDSILRSSTDEELQKKAIFSLSQMDSPRAGSIIRSYAERPGASEEVQEQAIFWIGQQNSSENATFLKGLYKKQKDQEIKEKIMFSLSQMKGQNSDRWLMDVATDSSEDVEMRKKALFWAGQGGVATTELTTLYGKMNNVEMKEQLIFVYSQRSDKAAVDKLLEIAKTEPDKELKKKAIFWLSQSNDPRAADLLQQIIDQ
jgi:HEAT repeat protein